MKKTEKNKTGFARLMELAGQKRVKITVACSLSVISSAVRLVPYFTIYGIIVLILSAYNNPTDISPERIRTHVLIFPLLWRIRQLMI